MKKTEEFKRQLAHFERTLEVYAKEVEFLIEGEVVLDYATYGKNPKYKVVVPLSKEEFEEPRIRRYYYLKLDDVLKSSGLEHRRKDVFVKTEVVE